MYANRWDVGFVRVVAAVVSFVLVVGAVLAMGEFPYHAAAPPIPGSRTRWAMCCCGRWQHSQVR